MALQDVLGEAQAILNRDDCSSAQMTAFITQAQQRIQRELKIPSMERSELITATAALSYIAIPADLLQVIDIFTDNWHGNSVALEKMSYRTLCRVPLVVPPQAYARLQNTLQIRGQVPTGGPVNLLYYGTCGVLANPTDDNELTLACPDLLVYGALSYAGDNCEHPSTQTWDARYQSILAQVQSEAIALESTGGPAVMQPFYNWSA